MEDEEVILEEGELSNDSDTYTPLERPSNYSSVQPYMRFQVVQQSESEEEIIFHSSESDSDSDPNVQKMKKPKIKLKPKRPQNEELNKKKNNIWSTRAQEELLAETLNSCDVTTKDRSRNVEYYDYTLGSKLYGELEEKKSNKRTRKDRHNINFRQRKRSDGEEKCKGKSRIISDLSTDLNGCAEEIAKDIANKLYEEKEDLIYKVINVIGKQKAADIFQETKRIEEDGGMLIMNQTRRRTPGGVFLFLVRQDFDITQDQKRQIFDEERQRSKEAIKSKQKQKNLLLKGEIALAKASAVPDLLTRAEILASQNPARKVKDQSEETNFVNPPPTPETDGHENSGDGMEAPAAEPLLHGNEPLEPSRGKLYAYDEDFLDITCTDNMDLF